MRQDRNVAKKNKKNGLKIHKGQLCSYGQRSWWVEYTVIDFHEYYSNIVEASKAENDYGNFSLKVSKS